MADKSISELVAATSVGSSDLFVLEQANTAKKLTGQILENWLVSFADGHGGIQSIAKTSSTGTNPVVDTYTITLSDTTTYDITVTNGVKGDTGAQTYVWIKWAAQQPTANNQMSNNPDKWIGIYSGTSSTAPANYTSYIWYEYKGEKGDTGDAVTRVARTSGTGEAGSTDVYTMYVGDPGTAIGSFTVVNGLNGTGSVNSVNGQLPDQNGNVEIEIPSSVYVGTTAPTDPDIVVWFDTDEPGASIVNSVNGESGVVNLDADDVGAMSKWALLWENGSPTSSFAAQTLDINLTNYDLVLCVFRNATLDSWVSVIIPVGVQGMLIVPHESASGGNFFRSFYPTTSGISIGEGTTGGVGTNNANNVPRLIYGIKGVISLI